MILALPTPGSLGAARHTPGHTHAHLLPAAVQSPLWLLDKPGLCQVRAGSSSHPPRPPG